MAVGSRGNCHPLDRNIFRRVVIKLWGFHHQGFPNRHAERVTQEQATVRVFTRAVNEIGGALISQSKGYIFGRRHLCGQRGFQHIAGECGGCRKGSAFLRKLFEGAQRFTFGVLANEGHDARRNQLPSCSLRTNGIAQPFLVAGTDHARKSGRGVGNGEKIFTRRGDGEILMLRIVGQHQFRCRTEREGIT